MWSTPSSTARRSTARAAPVSRGGPKTPGPASCIAPKPMRLIGLSPRHVIVALYPYCRCRGLTGLGLRHLDVRLAVAGPDQDQCGDHPEGRDHCPSQKGALESLG